MLNMQRWRDRQPSRQKKMRFSWPSLGFTLASCLGAVLTANSTTAQISGDGTLGTAVLGGPNYIITGGTTANTNLFHGFNEFSVPTGGSATFMNASGVQNIIGRVTGGSISNIDGNIATLNPANLFLINPAGIIFGPNATLFGFNGSFFASTADSILFADGVEFNTARPTSKPLLTVSAPVGLAFKGSQGQIRVAGPGHQHTILPPPGMPQGLQLFSGGTLALVGNGVSLEGGTVGAPDGRVEVASVAEGRVGLSRANGAWALTYHDHLNFADLQLTHRALIDASGLGGGSLQVAGRQISLQDGSLVLLQNFGSQPSGTLTVLASESVEVAGISSDGQISSGIVTDAFGSGRGADLRIRTNRLSLRRGGQVRAATYGQGRGGNMTVSASELVEVDGFAPQQPTSGSGLTTSAMGAGRSGDMTIDTVRLRVTNGATFGSIAQNYSTGDKCSNTINCIFCQKRVGSGSLKIKTQ
ncbi:MAG: filamentous hemagglutinin N-terminal domain-containing protein, partial [Spirulina sp.]